MVVESNYKSFTHLLSFARSSIGDCFSEKYSNSAPEIVRKTFETLFTFVLVVVEKKINDALLIGPSKLKLKYHARVAFT